MKIPLISDYRYYFGIFQRFIGKKFYLLLGITALAAITEAIGISMFLPLLKATGVGGNELGGQGQKLFDFLKWLGIPLALGPILLLIGGLFLLKGLIKFGEGAYRGYLTTTLFQKLKNDLFGLYAGVDYQFFASKNSGHFINVLNGQINKFIQAFNQLAQFSILTITTLIYLIFALYLNWRFTLMAMGAGGLLLFFLRFISAYSQRISKRVSQEGSQLNKFFIQTLHGMKYLKSTGRFERLKNETYRVVKKLAQFRFRLQLANSFIQAIREPFSVILMIGIILIQVYWMGQGVGGILVTLLLFYRAMNKLVQVQGAWQKLMGSVGGLEMTKDEFDKVTQKQEIQGSIPVTKYENKLELDQVSFAYEKGDLVLKGVTLTIPKNKTVALVGESGAGKSTLVDLLTFVLKPKEGEIYLDGVPSKNLDYKSWRHRIGYVTQDTVVFDDTVANNINLWEGDYNQDSTCQAKVEEKARQAHAQKFIEEMKNGFNTVIGDRGVRLSGGQKQRLSIARELYKEPDLLILDEATSALDTESEQEIQKSIDELKGKMTVVIIAHRLSTIKNADYIYVMDKGEVIEQGSYEKLISREDSKFKEMTELQSL